MTDQDSSQIQTARYGMLSEVELLIAKTADFERLQKEIIGKIKWVLDFNRCTLALLNSDGQTYQLKTLFEARRNVPLVAEEAVPHTQGLFGAVMQARQL